ncbi:MAG: cyclase family protein [Alphaproteobacteria bacterium]
MRQYFDISLPYTAGLTKWLTAKRPVIVKTKDMSKGDRNNNSRIEAGVHHGTHIDAPLHFIADGKSIESLPPEILIGTTTVVDLTHVDSITASVLEDVSLPPGCERVIFKTRNSDLWDDLEHEFRLDYVSVTPDGAQNLVDQGVKLVGVDYLSVEAYDLEGNGTHRTLLGAGVVIVEGLDLRGIEPGDYEMACLPIKIAGSDGAPARAILWRDD